MIHPCRGIDDNRVIPRFDHDRNFKFNRGVRSIRYHGGDDNSTVGVFQGRECDEFAFNEISDRSLSPRCHAVNSNQELFTFRVRNDLSQIISDALAVLNQLLNGDCSCLFDRVVKGREINSQTCILLIKNFSITAKLNLEHALTLPLFIECMGHGKRCTVCCKFN